MIELNNTHNPELKSWVQSANAAGSHFPIQNLPFAIFRRKNSSEEFRGGIAIGDLIVDSKALLATGILAGDAELGLAAVAEPTLNRFMSMGPASWSVLRAALTEILSEGYSNQSAVEVCLVSQSEAEFSLPCNIGDYTDFYTSVHHATNVGKQFRPDNPLLPNYKWVPIGYHGRASSIVVSGNEFPRPVGQLKPPEANEPMVGPCKRLDHELEMGMFIGPGNTMGEPIPIDRAEEHVFGICLFNDWSARDIQGWEYQPLGPFLSKSFASTISPWIVTLEALAPFRTPFKRPKEDPQPLPYLSSDSNSESGGVSIGLQVLIQTERMRQEGVEAEQIATSNFDYSYWTIAQLVAHHTINGCNLRPGDLFGSGTLSGPEAHEAGSMLELSVGGKTPVTLSNGESRTFIEDGDTVVLRGICSNTDHVQIGFGEVRSTVLPSNQN